MSGGLIPWQASNALINGRYLQPLVYDGHLPPTPSGPIGVVQKSGSARGGCVTGKGRRGSLARTPAQNWGGSSSPPRLPPLPGRKKQLKKKVKSAKVLLVEPKRHLSPTNLRPDPAYAAAAADGQAGPNSGKVQINVGASGSDRCQGGYVTEVTDRVLFAFPRVNDRVPLVLLQRQNSSPPWCPDAREEPEDMFARSRMGHFHWMASERLF